VVGGVLLSVGNPYWLLWWATVGAGYFIMFTQFGIAGLIAFYVGHVALDLGWNSLLAFLSASGRRAFPQPVYRGVLLACGLFLMAMSIYFVRSGVGFLRG
jgi:threonine/homoserine/homoserine lactone efflux protein